MSESENSAPKPTNKWVQYGGWLLGVIASLVTAAGYLSPEQVSTIKDVIHQHPPQPAVSTTETPVGGMSPEDLKLWTDQMLQIMNELKKLKPAPAPQPAPTPAPVPTPTPQPQPNPEPPPAPVPVDPQPAPSGLKIQIVDELDKPLTSTSVDAGRLFMVTANTKERVGWAVSKHGDVRLLVLPNNLGYAFSLQGGSFVEFFLTDSNLKAVSTRISCNQGPQPPPIIDPTPGPKPDPAPAPPVPKAEKLKLSVVYSTREIRPSTAKVLAATERWTAYEAKGHSWGHFPDKSNEPDAVRAKADIGHNSLPLLAIYSKTTGNLIVSIPLPDDMNEIDQLVKYYGGD